jgi:hypothetical protein
VSEKSAKNNLDYAVESERHGFTLFSKGIPALPCHTAEERYNSSESGLKKEIPVDTFTGPETIILPMRSTSFKSLRFAIIAVVSMIPVASLAQGTQLLKPGPLGRPALVRGEGEVWESPISIYVDSDTELLVSERLTLSGIYFDGPEFKKEGKYQTYIYSFYKTDRDCRRDRIPTGHTADPQWLEACAELRYNRRLVSVDTRNKTVTIQQVILMMSDGQFHPELMSMPKMTIPLDDTVNPALFHAITRITAMIDQEMKRHPE